MTIDHHSSARQMAEALRTKQVSARELLDLHLHRIESMNPTVNALVSIDADRARDAAEAADRRLTAGERLGPLHGLPFAVKDTHDVAGWRTTYGSPLMADHVPVRDELVVERVRAAGAVLLAKTNVPEFAAGSHTFNPVFGTTRNPYDTTRSAGGSSGGSAAALSTGMVPLADGSDFGGSLRNPASFCNVTGLRPTPGRVPKWPSPNPWDTMSVQGPMARDVGDLALLLSTIAGSDPRSPIGLETPGAEFAPALDGGIGGLRVAYSTDFGDAFEVDSRVAAITADAVGELGSAGAATTSAYPDLDGAEETFRTLRAWLFHGQHADLLARNPDGFKASLAQNIAEGEHLRGSDISRAFSTLGAIQERTRVFFESFDVLVMPVSQVPPFDAEYEYPTQINGRAQETYLDWMRSAYFITVTGCPAISVPFGFTDDGLPVGVQIVAAQRQERQLLEVAHAFEALTGAGQRRPALG